MSVAPTSRFLSSSPEFYEAGGASFRPQSHIAANPTPVDGAELARPADVVSPNFLGEDGFTFGDVLDAVNPLQHLPVVGAIYRQLTGDTMAPGARLAGGTLYGGPIGLAASVANVAVESVSGGDIGDNVFAMFTDGLAGDAPMQVAALSNAGTAAAAAAAAAPAAGAAAHTAATAAASAAPAAAWTAALPKVSGAAADVPSLSPAAFQALMQSVGAVEERAAPAAAAATPTALPMPVAAPVPGASMDVHNLLRDYAGGQGAILPEVRR